MVEPLSLQTTISLLTLISLTIGVFYHIMTLRNTRKNQELQLETRQAQLFMNLYETWSAPEFRKRVNWISNVVEYENSEDFHRKYGAKVDPDAFASWASVGAYYEGIGVLVRRGLIDIDLVDDLLHNSIIGSWESMGPEILDARATMRAHRGSSLFDDFEYLFREIQKRSATIDDT